MTGVDVVNVLIPKLLDMGIIVHRYNAYSTSSIYLKLDFGLTCGIRIADHPGKKKYSYRFNIIKDYVGDKVIIKDGLICYFYNYNELEKVLEAVKKENKKKSISMEEKIIKCIWKDKQNLIYIIDSKELEVKNNESNIRKNIKSFKIRNK